VLAFLLPAFLPFRALSPKKREYLAPVVPKSSIPHGPVQLALLYFLYQAKDFFSLGSTPTCSVKAQILLSISSHLLHVFSLFSCSILL